MIRTNDTSGTVLFEEKQNFPKWLVLIMLLPLVVVITVFVVTGVLRESMSEIWLMVFVIILLIKLTLQLAEKKYKSPGFSCFFPRRK